MFGQIILVVLIANVTLPAGAGAVDDEDPHPERAAPDDLRPPSSFPNRPPTVTPVLSDAAPRNLQNAIYYMVGAGTPVGVSGLEAVHYFGSMFEFAVGAGFGLAASISERKPNPIQWALMPRLRLGDFHRAFTVGAGISGGNYGLTICVPCEYVGYVLWGNVEIGGEYWNEGGFGLRYFAGYAHAFANGVGLNLPYFGLGLGYAF